MQQKAIPTYRLYGENSNTEPDFWMHCETIYARSHLYRFEIDLHRHEAFLQLLYFHAGDGEAVLKGQTFAITPPTAILVPAGFEHGFRFSRDIEGVIVTLLPAALPLAVQTVLRRHLADPVLLSLLSHADEAYLSETIRRIKTLNDRPAIGRSALLMGLVSSLLIMLTTIADAAQSGQGPALDPDTARMETLAGLIAAHVRQQHLAGFYADRLGLSLTHANRIAKARTGKTVQQLITQKLLETARQELIFSHSSVQDIGLALGFADPAYFSRFFSRECGVTPRAWRMMERQKLTDFTDEAHAAAAAMSAPSSATVQETAPPSDPRG
ncbi:helix-turn-helix domain-containing protein [Allorhizobium sp. BGMRC 0089]|uniref:helix-turn-helix domain-containing protein n=1 Tax=Allorhizobium sonneratiae TaxID=2934936 RepID=UPI002033D2C2|nr:helix-turn-helix domain-containing protein [Allorhizobium sonneratiae]MCM2293251.1 helix-turn-helix domain-containing protein [Allorhizobium sonneratiae]